MRDYLALITSEHAQRPRFRAAVDASVQPFVATQELLHSFLREFDLDYAVGAQLDIIGLWVGAKRTAPAVLQDFEFSWDDTPEKGWDNGAWGGIGGDVDDLPDDLYRQIIKAKIIANSSSGTVEDAYRIIEAAVSNPDAIRIVDGANADTVDFFFTWDGTPQNGWDAGAWRSSVTVDIMKMLVLVRDGALPAIEQALIMSGALPIKPAGVQAFYQLM